MALVVKHLPASAGDKEMRVRSLGREDPLEKGMATHSSILAWRIQWIEGPGGPQSMGLQRVGHDGETNTTQSSQTTGYYLAIQRYRIQIMLQHR